MSLHEAPADVLARLDAMRVQELTLRRARPSYPFAGAGAGASPSEDAVDASSRAAMATWLSQIQSALRLQSDTTWRALDAFDRYLASGRGRSAACLRSKCDFQLAAITCFYTCIKVYEPAILDASMMVKLCRGTYVEQDIVDMEMDVLASLGWRVAVHTPLEFVREALRFLPTKVDPFAMEGVLRSCQWHLDQALADADLSCARPSVLGLAALACSLAENEQLSLLQKQAVWTAASGPFAESSHEVVAAQDRLLAIASPCQSENVRPASRECKKTDAGFLRRSFSGGKGSPVSVAAPQA